MIVFIPLAWFTDLIRWGDVGIGIMCTLLPDADLKFNSHRNVIFHSIAFPLLTLFGTESMLEYVIILAFSLHLLLDIRLVFSNLKEQPGGFYLIQGLSGTRWKYHVTNLWLFGNAMLGFLIFGLKIIGWMP